jgi:hypothetical protein
MYFLSLDKQEAKKSKQCCKMNCTKVDELKHECCSETVHPTMLDQVNCFFISEDLFAHTFLSVFFKVAP